MGVGWRVEAVSLWWVSGRHLGICHRGEGVLAEGAMAGHPACTLAKLQARGWQATVSGPNPACGLSLYNQIAKEGLLFLQGLFTAAAG